MASLCGCSSQQKPPEFKVNTLELYLSRASFSGRDFEQYKIIDDDLFFECGVVKRGRHQVKDETFTKLSAAALTDLPALVWKLAQACDELKYPFEEPGQSRNMFDPGQVSFSAELPDQKLMVKTSLDSLIDPSNRARAALFELIALVRSFPQDPPCGSTQFYGLPRAAAKP
ncbi:MAG: hypothetical protein GX589_04765 [Deltaproteobacteria bacterium]|nr:hypothetical protein [Deltaproteobacteria bacterium]